jgi:hypothetical protein
MVTNVRGDVSYGPKFLSALRLYLPFRMVYRVHWWYNSEISEPRAKGRHAWIFGVGLRHLNASLESDLKFEFEKCFASRQKFFETNLNFESHTILTKKR